MNTFDKIMMGLARTFGLGLVLAAFCVWIYQLYWYLRHGLWLSLDVISLTARYADGPLRAWASVPSDWEGLHQMLSWVPVSLLVLLSGIGVIGATSD